nr:hypothetical protein CFP56_19590 [Quercus suber]
MWKDRIAPRRRFLSLSFRWGGVDACALVCQPNGETTRCLSSDNMGSEVHRLVSARYATLVFRDEHPAPHRFSRVLPSLSPPPRLFSSIPRPAQDVLMKKAMQGQFMAIINARPLTALDSRSYICEWLEHTSIVPKVQLCLDDDKEPLSVVLRVRSDAATSNILRRHEIDRVAGDAVFVPGLQEFSSGVGSYSAVDQSQKSRTHRNKIPHRRVLHSPQLGAPATRSPTMSVCLLAPANDIDTLTNAALSSQKPDDRDPERSTAGFTELSVPMPSCHPPSTPGRVDGTAFAIDETLIRSVGSPCDALFFSISGPTHRTDHQIDIAVAARERHGDRHDNSLR